MAVILCIETSTSVCSVALGRDGKCVAWREVNEGFTHAEKLTVFIQEIVQEAALTMMEIDAVAISSGPGSYTGLRIGLSTAKGLCFALEKPLIAIDTLAALAAGAREYLSDNPPDSDNYILAPVMDARRLEVYTAHFDVDLKELLPVCAKVMNENSFAEELNQSTLYFFGDGAEKLKSLFSDTPNAMFLADILPSARQMIELAEAKFIRQEFENTALFEPFYLKEFRPGPASKGN